MSVITPAKTNTPFPPHPLVYEVHTRCWLHELSERAGKPVALADVPESEFQTWRQLGFTHVWIMGIWKIGPRTRQHAFRHFPASPREQVVGSPYAIAAYEVSPAFGGEPGLLRFRARLASFGLKLLLDFIPNHLGLDHSWLAKRPELFVQAPRKRAGTFLQQTASGPRWLAHGRDPYFPPWSDTAQLDYRNPDTHQAMREELKRIANLCDGVRCDMAMLVLGEVFSKTWAGFPSASPPPATEFWAEAISVLKRQTPGFLLLAEAYWGLEPRLQTLGFDFTYDKIFYDHLVARRPRELQRRLLSASAHSLQASAHFLENHDEPRIASLLSLQEHRAAAMLLLSLPGMRLLHEGQLSGFTKPATIHLACRPFEPANSEVSSLYQRLLKDLQGSVIAQGHPTLIAPRAAWPSNPTAENFVIVAWASTAPEFELVVVNLAPHASQCYAPLPMLDSRFPLWQFKERFEAPPLQRDREALVSPGLYLDLPAHGAQWFRCMPLL